MSGNLTVKDLFSLEEYSEKRSDFRVKVMKHKRDRRVAIGPNLALYFESKLTIQYQVQEMLRIEKIFEKLKNIKTKKINLKKTEFKKFFLFLIKNN